MEQVNKLLSFILGIVVVAVFIVIASGKINLKGISFFPKTTTNITPTPSIYTTPKPTSKPWFSFLNKPTTTPTPKPTRKPIPTQKTIGNNNSSSQQQNKLDPNYHSYSITQVPVVIPNTGLPLVIFPLFGTSLLTGIFIKKAGKKD